MYGRTFIFVENFHVNNLSVVLKIFHMFNFRGTRVPMKIINLEHFPIYGIAFNLAMHIIKINLLDQTLNKFLM